MKFVAREVAPGRIAVVRVEEPKPLVEVVAETIRDWDWCDYGLDAVADAHPEYADCLARKIVEVVEGYAAT